MRNGAGKSTTLRILLGLVSADAGTATVKGYDYIHLPEPLHQVGAVLEANAFHPGRTARAHLRIQAMAASGLDPEGVRRLRDMLRGFANEGGTVLVSSHILAEVANTVDSVVIIDHDRLVRQGALADLTDGAADLEEVYFQLTREGHR